MKTHSYSSINWKLVTCLLKYKELLVLPSLYIFCQPIDLEILDLYEQLEDCVCEDNSYPLPEKSNSTSISLI